MTLQNTSTDTGYINNTATHTDTHTQEHTHTHTHTNTLMTQLTVVWDSNCIRSDASMGQ